MQNKNAYELPAAIFLGLGIHKLFESLFFIASKMSSARHTPFYKVAVLSCILLTGYLVSQITILDYLSNPYDAPPLYFRNLLIANYGFHLVSCIVVAFLFVMSVQEFYKDRIKFMIGMYSFFFLFATFKGTGGVAGVIVGFDVARWNGDYSTHPLFHIIPFLLAFGQFFEAIFATIGSVGFISALHSNQSEESSLFHVIHKEDGLQFLLVALIEWFIACLAIYSWTTGDYNFLTYVGLYMGCYSFGLQMHILLKNAHEPQKRLFNEQPVIRKVQSKQSSLALDNNALKAPIVHRIRSDSISRPKNSLQNNRDDDIVFVEFPLHRSQSTLFSPGVQEDEVKFWDEEDYSYYVAQY